MSESIQEYLSSTQLVNKDQVRYFSLVVDRVSTRCEMDEKIETRYTDTSHNITDLSRSKKYQQNGKQTLAVALRN